MPGNRTLKSVKLISWNANGLLNKLNELKTFVIDHDPDVLLVCETHAKPCNSLTIPNYKQYRNDRPHRHGGGTAIYVKHNINHSVPTELATELIETTTIQISTTYGPLLITSAYKPPQIKLLESDLHSLFPTDNPSIILGDLNSKHPSWNSRTTNTSGRTLHKYLDSKINLSIIGPHEPTFFSPNYRSDVLDIALLNNIPMQHYIYTIPELSSDHAPVLLQLNSPSLTDIDQTPKIIWDKLTNLLLNLSLKIPKISTPNEIDKETINLQTLIKNAIQQSTTTHVKPKQFIPSDIKNLIRSKNRAKRKYHKTLAPSDKTLLNKLQQQVKASLQTHFNERWDSKLRNLNTKDNSLWQMTKILRNPPKTNPPLHSTSGLVYTDADKAEALARSIEQQCTANYTHADLDFIDIVNKVIRKKLPNPPSNSNITPISLEELRQIIHKLKNSAPGADGISNKIIKILPKKLLIYLLNILNASLRTSHFPQPWKHAEIITIPKPGKDLKFPQNHRPISLLPALGKILEKAILTRLNLFINDNNIIPNEQHGFRSGHSTTHQLLRVTEFILKSFVWKQKAGAIILDVAKAFDTVWHKGLIFKLLHLNIPTGLTQIIKSYLKHRTFHVKYGHTLSEIKHIKAGVPQGSVLAPTLYNIFTHDIPKTPNTEIALYADDTAIIARSKSSDLLSDKLQKALTALEDWFIKWRIDVNPDKSHFIVFSRNREFRPTQLPELLDKTIPLQDKVKYLGVLLDRKLNFNAHIAHTASKATKVINRLFPLTCRKSKLSAHNKFLLYKTIVEPCLTYAAPIWSHTHKTNINKLQTIQNKYIRSCFNAPWFIRNNQLQAEAKVQPISKRIIDLSMNFLTKAAAHSNSTIADSLNYTPHDCPKIRRPKTVLYRD